MESTSSPALSTSTATEQKSDMDTAICMQELSFPALNTALDEHIAAIDGPRAGPWERRFLIIGAVGAGAGMLLGSTLPGNYGLIAALAGLAVEILGFGFGAVLTLRRDWRQLWFARSEHAHQLERGYANYQLLIQQARHFPLAERQLRQRYIQDRLATVHQRLGLFTGGMERLGILPILIAVYLQFKDWQWGDWNVFANISLVQGVMAFLILFSYAMAWFLIRLHARMQAYAQLLAEANAQDAG